MPVSDGLEALMLVCFSISWYWSIAKMLRTRVAAGKSAFFVVLICTGYVFGVASKLIAWQGGGPLSPLVWLYAWNLCVTLADLALVIRFSQPTRGLRVVRA
jgi:hypothetical protein